MQAGTASQTLPRLTRSRAQLRREIPETVAACQAQLDERLPQTLKAVAVGDLVERAAAALAAHDTQLPAKQEETRRVISRLYEQQERKAAQTAAAQQARRTAEQCLLSAHSLTPVVRAGAARAGAASGARDVGGGGTHTGGRERIAAAIDRGVTFVLCASGASRARERTV